MAATCQRSTQQVRITDTFISRTFQLSNVRYFMMFVVLTEREIVNFYLRIKELNLKFVINNGALLTNNLVHALFCHHSIPITIHVQSMSNTRRLSVNKHTKLYRLSWFCWSHN